MVYLKNFTLPNEYKEHYIAIDRSVKRLDNSMYPLHIFPPLELERLLFSEITIIYGGNGSGKSTLLNIISSKLGAFRKSPLEKGLFFDRYIRICDYETTNDRPMEIKVITSDDVFDYLLDIRAINSRISRRKDELSEEYLVNKYTITDDDIFDYERIKAKADSLSKNQAKYVRARLANNNITEHSNGESALLFWEREIKENSIYILDEPENSLSAENQLKLKQFIEDSARFYNCQFIISTHSPFLLSLVGATIYDLDTIPVHERKWTELKNVRLYYDFFKEHEYEFED